MTYQHFESLAWDMFHRIPEEYREGVDGLEVSRAAVPHPSLPEIYTLGECRSEFYPSDYGGAGEVRSIVALYYGSFLELSRLDEEWDWEGELWETITHEVRHHLESLASEDALEVQDYAEDQNFARREGEAFEPLFYRSGTRLREGLYEVDGDHFLEIELGGGAARGGAPLEVAWPGRRLALTVPAPLGDVHYLRLEGLDEGAGERLVVLVRRRGAWDLLRGMLRGGRLEVRESAVDVGALR